MRYADLICSLNVNTWASPHVDILIGTSNLHVLRTVVDHLCSVLIWPGFSEVRYADFLPLCSKLHLWSPVLVLKDTLLKY